MRSSTGIFGGTTASRSQPPGSRRRTQTLLIDWELAGRGEAALDIGTVLAEYLSAWVGSIPIVEVATPGRLLSHARYPLRRMQPAIDAFWSAYRASKFDAAGAAAGAGTGSRPPVEDGGRARTSSRRAVSAPRDAAAARRERLARARERGPHAAGAARMTGYRDQLMAARQGRHDPQPNRVCLARSSQPTAAEIGARRIERCRVSSASSRVLARGAVFVVLHHRRPGACALGRAQPVAADPRSRRRSRTPTSAIGSWELSVDRRELRRRATPSSRRRGCASASRPLDCRADDGGPIRSGAAVSVRLPKELPALSPGLLHGARSGGIRGPHLRRHRARVLAHHGVGGTSLGARTQLAPERRDRSVPAEGRQPPNSLRSLRRRGAVSADRGIWRASRQCSRTLR